MIFQIYKEYLANDGVAYGGSAGSIIFGHDIDVCGYMDPNDIGLSDTSGFGLLNGVSVAAHYTNQNEEKTNTATAFLTEYSKKELVIALPEENSIYVDNGIMRVIGTRNYYVFNKGQRKEFQPSFKNELILS